MKTVNKSIWILSLLLLVGASAIAGEREWQSTLKLDDGRSLILHWAGVHEGRDTVYQITLDGYEFHLGKKNAAGQPLLNKQKTFIALPYCADDGCSKTINVFDINEKHLLSPIQLEYEGQFYVECKWNQNTLYIDVDHGPFQGKAMIDHYIANVDSGQISVGKLPKAK